MHKYEIVLEWSDDDGAFVAEVPELPGCMAHGDTRQAALVNAGQAMDLWIETAREFGYPIPEARGEYSSGQSRTTCERTSESPRLSNGGMGI